MIKWYQIRVEGAELTPSQIHMYFYQIEKHELYVSPHVKLAGQANVAQISDKEIAQSFLDKCLPIFRKRYGDDTELVLEEWSTGSIDKSLSKHLERDTHIVLCRLAQNNFSPNKNLHL